MDENLSRKLDEINKQIFVKAYQQADQLLAAILASRGNEEQSLVLHLRRIELASKLSGIAKLRDSYLEQVRNHKISQKQGELCIALAEQQGELVPAAESVQKFTDWIKLYGETAAAYFGLAFSLESQGNTERAKYNYQQSIKVDASWYPAYFSLSQIHYRNDDPKDGDHYFYLFEKFAPYNLYGNFETHKNLCAEFIQKELYTEAEMAIVLLGQWWIEHRGFSPIEVQVYEKLMLSSIAEKQADNHHAESHRQTALYLVAQACHDKLVGSDSLYFLAKSLEEFGEEATALSCYRQLLKRAGKDNAMVQKIAQNLFNNFAHQPVVQEIFTEAYRLYPDLSHIRLCWLISKLHAAKVSVDHYLLEKEGLLQRFGEHGQQQDILPQLQKILLIFDADPDIHAMLAVLYHQKGDLVKAEQHYRIMLSLDPQSKAAALKFATFLSEQQRSDEAQAQMQGIQFDETIQPDQYIQYHWLQALGDAQKKEYQSALKHLDNILLHDPWNVNYVSVQADWLWCQEFPDLGVKVNPLQQQRQGLDVDEARWAEFAQETASFAREQRLLPLVYARQKLSLLYAGGDRLAMQQFVVIAAALDAEKARGELLFLLNTNFDSPWVLWGLGCLSKELWQLQTASMWFELVLKSLALSPELRYDTYLELADCYVWTNLNIQKSIEYINLIKDALGQTQHKALVILAHAYLNLGQLREAQACLDQLPKGLHNFEGQYLAGLLLYRNGLVAQAKKLWKPLLAVGSENLRFHHIKQELLQYYFDRKSYLKAL